MARPTIGRQRLTRFKQWSMCVGFTWVRRRQRRVPVVGTFMQRDYGVRNNSKMGRGRNRRAAQNLGPWLQQSLGPRRMPSCA